MIKLAQKGKSSDQSLFDYKMVQLYIKPRFLRYFAR